MATSKTKLKTQVKSYTFEAVIEPDFFEDGREAYHAYIPAIRGCSTWGYTVEEALKNLEETAKMLIDLMIELGEPIPEQEAKAKPRITINLPVHDVPAGH